MKHFFPASDPEFWRRAWQEARAASPLSRRDRFGRREEIEHWNRRAASHARQIESPDSRTARRCILRWLSEQGAVQVKHRVLDIGAGPGTFALPMAARVKEVVAVEPAAAMAALLARKARARTGGNIRIVQKTWQEIDLEQEGWDEAFDLVFASMSPGISDPEALLKMVQASRAFCYLSGWSGPLWGRWGRARSELWPQLFHEDPGHYPNDIFYPFSLLYALGYRPELRFRRQALLLSMEPEAAVEELVSVFERYARLTVRIRRLIEEYVREHIRGGLFRQESRQCQGFMLWAVERPG